jgi:hypothetical protein
LSGKGLRESDAKPGGSAGDDGGLAGKVEQLGDWILALFILSFGLLF